jgi:predicted enzyme related to lactoylglutathione lyase
MEENMTDSENELAGWPLPEQGEFVWTEIGVSYADKCQAFYENVFGWKFKSGGADVPGMDYREFSTDGEIPIGGLYQIDPAFFGDDAPRPHFLTYVAVDNVDQAAKKVEDLGGKVHKTIEVPNVGRMSVIEDPSGAMIATFRMKD